MTPEFLKYVRHLSKQDRKNLSQKTLKVAEEVGELAKVALPYDNAYATTHRFVERERILEESVDVILTAISVAYDLDFTDDEIDSMLALKAEKWAMLQYKESQIVYPLPYEIHITIKPHNDNTPEQLLAQFKVDCATVGVKPIILDLQNREGVKVMDDVMTSSKHFGDNASAFKEAQRISEELAWLGYDVVRTKIETVPWHPAAPIDNQPMPPDCYFESHIPIFIKDIDITKLRQNLPVGLHLSQNVFKRTDDGTAVIMGTLRSYNMSSSAFQCEVKRVVEYLTVYGYSVGKTHVEFAIYDTKGSHDSAWIESK